MSRISTADLRKWRRRGFYSEGALVKFLEKNNYHAVRVPVSNPSLHPLPDVIARKGEHVYAFEVKNAGYYAYFPKQQMDKLFRFLDELIPLPIQQKHPILAAHLGKRWVFKELKWEDWKNDALPEQERILKRDKGNFDVEEGEKKTRSQTQELPGLIFDKMGKYWDAVTNTHPTEKEVEFIQKTLPNNGLTLDLCCGTGRHAILLAKKGWSMVGADLSKSLLIIAKDKMRRECVDFPLVRCEMQRFPFKDEIFSAVVSMFTSFGYLHSETEDLHSLREIARALRPRGAFLLDVVNRDYLLKVFKESDVADFGNFTMEEKRNLDESKTKMAGEWIITNKDTGEKLVLKHRLRLYTPQNLSEMLTLSGLQQKTWYGNYESENLASDSPRLIVLAEKTL
ncbi:MAG: methyltransferase domain-containing protein [Candidatus Bathyarchaeia archaeon]|nr:methyltransferase domain-containing protein [Candidatus Bathyarchaeota archaeon A05DMB-4]MDH7595934.1 methyltransferase domain-containing protein [Candidatus Bathyarchaeota archaeon]